MGLIDNRTVFFQIMAWHRTGDKSLPIHMMTHLSQVCITSYKGSTYLITHWGQVPHICVSRLTIIGSNNGLSPGLRQAIIWTNAGILLIWTSGTNFNEILSEIHTFSVKKMYLKMSSAKWRQFCLRLNVLSGICQPCIILWKIHYTTFTPIGQRT